MAWAWKRVSRPRWYISSIARFPVALLRRQHGQEIFDLRGRHQLAVRQPADGLAQTCRTSAARGGIEHGATGTHRHGDARLKVVSCGSGDGRGSKRGSLVGTGAGCIVASGRTSRVGQRQRHDIAVVGKVLKVIFQLRPLAQAQAVTDFQNQQLRRPSFLAGPASP